MTMDLNNPTPEEIAALSNALRAAPGILPDFRELAVIAFAFFAERSQGPRLLEGWWRGEPDTVNVPTSEASL